MEKRPPYLIRTVTRHGKVAWYVWRRPGPKIRIQGEYGSREFMRSYRAALYGEEAPQAPAGAADSLSSLIRPYRKSPAWARLSEATRKQRGNMFDRIERAAGDRPWSDFDSAVIKRERDKLGYGAAKHFLQTMRGLFKWAKEQELVESDPTEGITTQRTKTDGFETWSQDDIRAYEARWPIGTRERLWMALLFHTGLRRGDACALGPHHIRDGNSVIEFATAKTGATITIPLAPELVAIIANSPIGEETFIATVYGKPMSKEFFGNLFREACDKAGVKKSAHGLRKAAAVRLAEAGASVAELNAWFGWSGAKMASLYVEKADRARLARQAMERLTKKKD